MGGGGLSVIEYVSDSIISFHIFSLICIRRLSERGTPHRLRRICTYLYLFIYFSENGRFMSRQY